MKIYGFSTFNVTKVLFVAEEIGLDYDYVALNPNQAEQKLPEHLSRHPMGKVPALEHDGRYLFESAAICRYLARISHSSLYDGDAYEKSVIDAWVDLSAIHIGRWLGSIAFNEIVLHGMMGQPLNEETIGEARQFLSEQLPAVEQQLSLNSFLAGDHLTIADAILASLVQLHEITSFEIEPWPNIQRWYASVRGRPAYQRALDHFPDGKLFGL